MSTIADVLAGTARWCVVEGESLALLQALPDASVDALITDPPYSSGGAFRGDRTSDTTSKYTQSGASEEYLADVPAFTGDSRDQRAFSYWCALWLSEAMRASREGAPVVQFTDWRQIGATIDSVQAGGWVWRGVFVWDKGDCGRPQKGRFRASSEFGVWGSNGPMPIVGECLPGSFRENSVPGSERAHATQKPVEVMRVVTRVCKAGGIILDPFAGSGSTGVAALREGRRFIGFEKSPHYAAVARERLAAEESLSTRAAKQAGQRPLFGGES